MMQLTYATTALNMITKMKMNMITKMKMKMKMKRSTDKAYRTSFFLLFSFRSFAEQGEMVRGLRP